MKAQDGLTLIEVMIALFIVAVGILAAVLLQTNALRASSKARAIQEVTQLAEAELEYFSSINLSDTTPECQSTMENGYTCAVDTTPCELDTTTTPPTLKCDNADPANADAFKVNVTINGPREASVTLETVVSK